MNLSLSTISAGAMTTAMSIGTAVHQIGLGAMQALPTVTSGGAQAIASGANAAAQTLPQSVAAGATGTAQLASDLAVVEKPASTMAGLARRNVLLVRGAAMLSRVLPVVAVGASALSGARIVDERGSGALLTSKDGRGAVLGALGGALLLVPTPATQLAAAGVLAAVAVNHFDGMRRLDRPSAAVPAH